mgnify:CR=1 FL=1
MRSNDRYEKFYDQFIGEDVVDEESEMTYDNDTSM